MNVAAHLARPAATPQAAAIHGRPRAGAAGARRATPNSPSAAASPLDSPTLAFRAATARPSSSGPARTSSPSSTRSSRSSPRPRRSGHTEGRRAARERRAARLSASPRPTSCLAARRSVLSIAVVVGPRWFAAVALAALERVSAHRRARGFLARRGGRDPLHVGKHGAREGRRHTHGIFEAQPVPVYGFRAGESSCAAFALSPPFGMTTVFPTWFLRPSRCDPARSLRRCGARRDHDLRLARDLEPCRPWCRKHQVTLPRLRRVLVAGAPVSVLVEGCADPRPRGRVRPTARPSTPSSISGADILDRRLRGRRPELRRPAGAGRRDRDRPLARARCRHERRPPSPRGVLGEICARTGRPRQYAADPE